MHRSINLSQWRSAWFGACLAIGLFAAVAPSRGVGVVPDHGAGTPSPPAAALAPTSTNASPAATTTNLTLSSTGIQPPPITTSDTNISGVAFGAEAGYQMALCGDYRTLKQVAITGQFVKESQAWIGVQVGASAIEFKPDSNLAQQVAKPLLLEAGAVVHQYFTPPHTFLRPYVAGGFSLFGLNWQYRNPPQTDTGPADWDFIHGFGATAGLGMAVQPARSLNLFAEFDVGGVIFPDQTTLQGFNNTLFNNFSYTGMRAGLRLKL